MIPGQYPTAGDARVYINEFWIDDTLRCDVDVQHRKIPLYGYHQKYYADVAAGKVIVTGSLMVHFRFPGYLMYAIGKHLGYQAISTYDREKNTESYGPSPQVAGQASTAPGLRTEPQYQPGPNDRSSDSLIVLINELRQMSPEGRVQRLAQATENNEFVRISNILNSLFGETTQANDTVNAEMIAGDPVEMSPDDFGGGAAGFNVDIVYNRGQDRFGRGYKIRETVHGVHLTGRRKVLNASTTSGDLGSSGSTLVEIYPFIAKRVDRYVTDYEGRVFEDYDPNTDSGTQSMRGTFLQPADGSLAT